MMVGARTTKVSQLCRVCSLHYHLVQSLNMKYYYEHMHRLHLLYPVCGHADRDYSL